MPGPAEAVSRRPRRARRFRQAKRYPKGCRKRNAASCLSNDASYDAWVNRGGVNYLSRSSHDPEPPAAEPHRPFNRSRSCNDPIRHDRHPQVSGFTRRSRSCAHARRVPPRVYALPISGDGWEMKAATECARARSLHVEYLRVAGGTTEALCSAAVAGCPRTGVFRYRRREPPRALGVRSRSSQGRSVYAGAKTRLLPANSPAQASYGPASPKDIDLVSRSIADLERRGAAPSVDSPRYRPPISQFPYRSQEAGGGFRTLRQAQRLGGTA